MPSVNRPLAMKRRLLHFCRPALAVALMLAAQLALAQDNGAPSQPAAEPEPVIAAGDNHPSDADIDRRIEEIFREIEGLEGLAVSVKAGVVTLRGEVPEGALSDQAAGLAGRVEGVVAVNNEIAENVEVGERLVPVFDRLAGRASQLFGYLPLLSVAGLAFIVIALAGWWIAARNWPWSRLAPNAFIANLLRQIVRLVFFGLGLGLALDILGATALLGTIVGAAGIFGLAIGFAVRDTVENYIASILLSIRQPFRPNDHILIEGLEGRVIRLTSRATILMSLDGNHVRIPNATVFKGVITNYTRNPERRFDFELGVDAESDLSRAIELGLETMRGLGFVLDEPGPDAWIKAVGDSNIVIWYSGWIDQTKTDFAKARSEAMRLTKLALESNGFSLPEPIYRLRFEQAVGPIGVEPRPAPVKKSPPAPVEPESAVPTDTTADDSVKQMVEEDRSASNQKDLLNPDAPTELE
ncbi:MAG TPA: mechanosensitive ion channel family protein [Afifellaceae bacterium]|nr:mechanosensitive ion channel family protein [Afifellaceae bacterium]